MAAADETKASPKPRRTQKRTTAEASQARPQAEAPKPTVSKTGNDASRIVQEGEVIDVRTDENGVAEEDVLQKRSIPNSKKPVFIQIAVKGTRYKR